MIAIVDGWSYLFNKISRRTTTRQHYFKDGKSLCEKWKIIDDVNEKASQPNNACVKCYNKAKELGLL